jgi:hypothetical protein
VLGEPDPVLSRTLPRCSNDGSFAAETNPVNLAFIRAGMGAAMELTLRQDWWARLQIIAAMAAIGLMGSVVFGLI